MRGDVLAIILFCSISSVTATQAQVNFAIKGGMNLNEINNNFKSGSNWRPWETKKKAGYHLGAMIIYDFNMNVGLQSGLMFTSKGTSYDLDEVFNDYPYPYEVEVTGYSRSTFNYFEIPIQAVYQFYKTLRVFGGPYLAIGLGGKDKDDYTLIINNDAKEVHQREKSRQPVFGAVELNYEKNPFRGIDYGANLGIGYKIKPFTISAEYSLGMRDLNPEISGSGLQLPNPDQFPPGSVYIIPSNKQTNRVIYFSLSYSLSKP
jgi:hypothetical protein